MYGSGRATDLDSLSAAELTSFADSAIASYADRDAMIEESKMFRSEAWIPKIPPAYQATTEIQHSGMGKSIPLVALGVVSLNKPTYSRTPPDEKIDVAEKADTVERYLQARFEAENAEGKGGQSTWFWTQDQMANYGGAVIQTLYQPHSWANSPSLTTTEGKIRKAFWRDHKGELTDKEDQINEVASSKAYTKMVDHYRKRAVSPILRRYPSLDESYPVYVGNTMVAFVIRREMSALELAASGFEDVAGVNMGSLDMSRTTRIVEVWTPNRARYLCGGQDMRHQVYGNEGIVHNYGFVPFAHQIGLPSDSNKARGSVWGLSVLSLVAGNIKQIDTYMTVRDNAAKMVGFPTMVWEDIAAPDAVSVAAGDDTPKHFNFETGKILYFRGRRLKELAFSGLNKDWEVGIREEREEVRKIIPDILFAKPASSGYNSALMDTKVLAFFGPPITGTELLYKQQGQQELRLINDRVPGPIYLDYAYRDNELGVGPKRVARTKIEASDIDGYYGLSVDISRVTDRIALGNWLAQMRIQGFGYDDLVLDGMGITDTGFSKRQKALDDFMKTPEISAVTIQGVIKRLGLEQLQEEAQAAQQLAALPDGSPGVALPSGGIAAPGIARQTPQQQGAAGAMLGGANMNSTGPNGGSVGNPNIASPKKGQPDRLRRRGGALPGIPQNQGLEKTVRP